MPKLATGNPRGRPPAGGWTEEDKAKALAGAKPPPPRKDFGGRVKLPPKPPAPKPAKAAPPPPQRAPEPVAAPAGAPEPQAEKARQPRPRTVPAHLIRMAHPDGLEINGPGVHTVPDDPGVAYVEIAQIPDLAAHGFVVEH